MKKNLSLLDKMITFLNNRTVNSLCYTDLKKIVIENNKLVVYECCGEGYSPYWIVFKKKYILERKTAILKIFKFLYEKEEVLKIVENFEKWPKYEGGISSFEYSKK